MDTNKNTNTSSSSSYGSIVCFLLTTLLYYLCLKPKKTWNNENPENITNLAIFFLLVLISQFMVNASVIANNCGGNISENIGSAFMFTFFPWTMLFGTMMLILLAYPGFKSAFADVIGYFYVASSANKVLTELLINKDVKDKLPADVTEAEKSKMMDAADTIIKICGNTSILINQMVPSNFNEYWNVLTPLMKPQFHDESSQETINMKNDLFELVVTRDNVGEAMWFIYTGFLITSIIQLKINTKGCNVSPQQMAKNYQDYLDKEEKTQATTELATSQEYVITN
jgi:uncharacterized membrane protein required for colicin V production